LAAAKEESAMLPILLAAEHHREERQGALVERGWVPPAAVGAAEICLVWV
jgi:hypothetical protein